MNEVIKSIEKKQLKENVPEIAIGDTVREFVKVVEGNRERLQAFEGVVIARKGGGLSETFTAVSYTHLKASMSSIRSPMPQYHTGYLSSWATAKATPPLAVPSSLVIIMPSTWAT